MTKRNNKSNWSHGEVLPEKDLPDSLKTKRICLHPQQAVVWEPNGLAYQKCLRCGHTVEVEKP